MPRGLRKLLAALKRQTTSSKEAIMNYLRIGLTGIALGLAFCTQANACPQSHDVQPCVSSSATHEAYRARTVLSHRYTSQDGRPRSWCGWYMRQRKGIADRSYNLARNWTRWGSPSRPRAGVIVVWRSHVGEIVNYEGGCTATVHSGNDGGAVRTRERNICNAIAFRA